MIRSATIADLVRIEQIEKRFGADSFSKRSLRHFILSFNPVIVFEKDNIVVGCCIITIKSNSNIARIYSIAVDENYEGIGIGKSLMEASEKKALKLGKTVMSLEFDENNISARKLYERMNYKEISYIPDYYDVGRGAVKMVKHLV